MNTYFILYKEAVGGDLLVRIYNSNGKAVTEQYRRPPTDGKTVDTAVKEAAADAALYIGEDVIIANRDMNVFWSLLDSTADERDTYLPDDASPFVYK